MVKECNMLIIVGKNVCFVCVKYVFVWSIFLFYKSCLYFERLVKFVFVGCWEILFFYDNININVILEYYVSFCLKKDMGIMIEWLFNVLCFL